jgi:uncharacterized membrane protein
LPASESSSAGITVRGVLVLATATEDLEDAVRDAVDFAIPVVEAIGAAIIIIGVLLAAASYVLSELRIRPVAYEHLRLQLGRYIVLGIEFQLASDLLTTAVSPTWREIGMLGAIAGIRTVLNYFLVQEIEKVERLEREGMLKPRTGMAPSV